MKRDCMERATQKKKKSTQYSQVFHYSGMTYDIISYIPPDANDGMKLEGGGGTYDICVVIGAGNSFP